MIVYAIVQAVRAGPPQLSDEKLQRALPVLRVTPDEPGPGWQDLGKETRADGLKLRFDADDDPWAEATLVLPGAQKARPTLAHKRTVTLGAEFETHHVHTRGYVFRIRLRGTGTVVGKQTQIAMVVGKGDEPYGGRVENDDDTDAAVGGWIEVESAEILRVPA